MKRINHKVIRQLIILSFILFLGGLIITYMLPYISRLLRPPIITIFLIIAEIHKQQYGIQPSREKAETKM
jgi:hypothetical protein